MQKKKLKTFGLTLIAFALSLFAVQAVEVISLEIYPAGGITVKHELEQIQRISFSAGGVLVKHFGADATNYAFENIIKIIFGTMDPVANSLVIADTDVTAYITSAGELVVFSSADFKSLTLLSIDGKILQKGISSPMFVGSLPASIYLLQIDTTQGTIVKKLVKQ